jgi:hypothetical protein
MFGYRASLYYLHKLILKLVQDIKNQDKNLGGVYGTQIKWQQIKIMLIYCNDDA